MHEILRFLGCASAVLFGLFRTDAGGATVKDRIKMLESWNAIDILVGGVEILITRMTKSLMPEHTFSIFANSINRGMLFNN